MKAIMDGLKFGMLLQLAIGPICLLIFKISGSSGFPAAMAGVAAVVLVDSLFILLAILGIASFVGRENVKRMFNYIGAFVVGLFGIATILAVFGINPVPAFRVSESIQGAGPFIEAFVLTAANPLTILFWAGVFSARLAEGKLAGGKVYLFGLGSALSTLIALTATAAIGTLTGTFLPVTAIEVLNFAIGAVLIAFAFKMAMKTGKAAVNGSVDAGAG